MGKAASNAQRWIDDVTVTCGEHVGSWFRVDPGQADPAVSLLMSPVAEPRLAGVGAQFRQRSIHASPWRR
jgi:hypothetical protein